MGNLPKALVGVHLLRSIATSYTQIVEVCDKNKGAGKVSEFNTNKSLLALVLQAVIL